MINELLQDTITFNQHRLIKKNHIRCPMIYIFCNLSFPLECSVGSRVFRYRFKGKNENIFFSFIDNVKVTLTNVTDQPYKKKTVQLLKNIYPYC